ncbi:MAG: Maf family nucleotide pyrophosphatase [Flavobacteriaceae bacterium]
MTNPLFAKLEGIEIVLASGSPRRKAFLEELQLPFRVQSHPVDESYPPELTGAAIARYIVEQKIKPFQTEVSEHKIVIAADTIVWKSPHCLGKPKDEKEATAMLQLLSGDTHEVITAVGFWYKGEMSMIHATSKVFFKKLTDHVIQHYIQSSQPYDKAGAYGIQEWIGTVGVDRIEGSYTNIVGLPTAALIEHLTLLLTPNDV